MEKKKSKLSKYGPGAVIFVLAVVAIVGWALYFSKCKGTTGECTYDSTTCRTACQSVGESKYQEGLEAGRGEAQPCPTTCPTTVGVSVRTDGSSFQFGPGFALRTQTHRLSFQNDGNFLIARNPEPGSWTAPLVTVSTSNTKNNAASKAVRGEFTSSGVLRLFNAADYPVWTVSPPTPGNTLSIGADGKLQILDEVGEVVWSGAMNSVPVTPGP